MINMLNILNIYISTSFATTPSRSISQQPKVTRKPSLTPAFRKAGLTPGFRVRPRYGAQTPLWRYGYLCLEKHTHKTITTTPKDTHKTII